ncbi:MAG: DNA-binding protein [Chlorobi bacterium]|jgi:predicted nucleic-acid-binding Zn-ribbon protein|nr:DNA-binding protein [Chlorobiota bacterium]
MEKKEYVCPKCGNRQYEVDQMRATGGAFAKIFDVQNKKFTMISCTQCGYTELYKRASSTFGNVIDFFTN